jgi:hypothetical protein
VPSVLGDNSQLKIIRRRIDLSRLDEVHYSGTATTGRNHLMFSYISDSAAASHPTIKGYARLRYRD